MSVVRVFGLTTGIHTIEDIGVAVPVPAIKLFLSRSVARISRAPPTAKFCYE